MVLIAGDVIMIDGDVFLIDGAVAVIDCAVAFINDDIVILYGTWRGIDTWWCRFDGFLSHYDGICCNLIDGDVILTKRAVVLKDGITVLINGDVVLIYGSMTVLDGAAALISGHVVLIRECCGYSPVAFKNGDVVM